MSEKSDGKRLFDKVADQLREGFKRAWSDEMDEAEQDLRDRMEKMTRGSGYRLVGYSLELLLVADANEHDYLSTTRMATSGEVSPVPVMTRMLAHSVDSFESAIDQEHMKAQEAAFEAGRREGAGGGGE